MFTEDDDDDSEARHRRCLKRFHPSVNETSLNHRRSTRYSASWYWFCISVGQLISNDFLYRFRETSTPMSVRRAWSTAMDWRHDPVVSVSSPSGPNSRLMQEVNHSRGDLCGWDYNHIRARQPMLACSHSEHTIGQDCDFSNRRRVINLCRVTDCPGHRLEWLRRLGFELSERYKAVEPGGKRDKIDRLPLMNNSWICLTSSSSKSRPNSQ